MASDNSQINDLDLLSVPSEDIDQLASKIESFYKMDSIIKNQLSYHWTRNHMMLDGEHWLVYDTKANGGGEWRAMQPSSQNDYIPRPVTNYMFDAYQTLKSYLLKNKPRSTVRANTQTQKDKQAAKLAELIVETNWERLGEDYNYENAAAAGVTYGTVFKKDYWDMSYLSVARIPRTEERPTIDPNSGQVIGMETVEVKDENGNPVYDEIPIGDVATAIVDPQRMTLDPLASNLQTDLRWIMEYSIKPLNWITENYSQSGDGYTGRAEEVKEEKTLSNSMRRYFRLKTSSGVKASMSNMPGTGSSASGSDIMINNAAIVKEYYERPTHKYPKGRLIVVANGIPLYVGESPYTGPDQGDWHPYSEFRWELVPGRFWGKSPLDEVADLNRQVNSIDSIVTLTRKTMAVPQKLIPQGCAIPPGSWTGRPGLHVQFRDTGGSRPEIIPATGVDAQVWQERSQKTDDIKGISGAVDILKGDKPPGVNAASALAILFEVGTGKLFPILDRWKKFIENSQKKQLKLIAKRYREPRPEFIRLIAMRNNDLTEAEIKNFIGSDLYDNCNVIIEAASSIPKLKAAEHAMLLELASYGVLGLENPQNRQEFLKRFGVTGFDSDFSTDVRRAEYENSMFETLLDNPESKPVVLMTDNHEVHKEVHAQFTKNPKFLAQPFEVQQAVFLHIEEHDAAIMQKQQEQMMQQAAMGQMPQPPQGEPNPMQNSPHIKSGSGVGDKIKKSLMGDALGPFGTLSSS